MKMKILCTSIACSIVLLLATPLLGGQDLSNYRTFSLGASLATVLKHTDQKLADVKVTHSRPGLMQEFTWWPPSLSGTPYHPDTVEQMRFSSTTASSTRFWWPTIERRRRAYLLKI